MPHNTSSTQGINTNIPTPHYITHVGFYYGCKFFFSSSPVLAMSEKFLSIFLISYFFCSLFITILFSF